MKPLAFAADALGLDYVICMGFGRARIALKPESSVRARAEDEQLRLFGRAARGRAKRCRCEGQHTHIVANIITSQQCES